MALIDQAQLESRIGGAEYLIRCTDDDRDGVADPSAVSDILEEASQVAIGLLWDGFPSTATITTLAANDVAVVGAICDVACGLAGQRRPDLVGPAGAPLFAYRRAQGEKTLKDIAQAKRRSAGEAVVGRNRLLSNRTSRDIATRPYLFQSSSKDGKGPGGF